MPTPYLHSPQRKPSALLSHPIGELFLAEYRYDRDGNVNPDTKKSNKENKTGS